MKTYACIKNGIIDNILIFDENDTDTMTNIKEEFGFDELVVCDNLHLRIGFLYDGTDFYQEEGKKAVSLDEPGHENDGIGEERTEEDRLRLMSEQ